MESTSISSRTSQYTPIFLTASGESAPCLRKFPQRPTRRLSSQQTLTPILRASIINSEHSKITLNTTNVFIDVTATDRTKLDIVVNMIVSMFSIYCEDKFTVEPVKIISEHNGQTRIAPPLVPRKFDVEVSYVNECCGLSETPESMCKLLNKMAYTASPSPKDKNLLVVYAPPTRADVLHQCDIVSLSFSPGA